MFSSTPSQSSDTDTFHAVAEVSPIEDLQSVVPLILDPSLRDRYVDDLFRRRPEVAPEMANVVSQIFQTAARLASMTEWQEEFLLEKLGCVTKTVEEFKDVELDGLTNCLHFLRLVSRNARLVSTSDDRRHVVIDTAKLLKAIGGDIDTLDVLMETTAHGYSAVDLLRVGEIGSATAKVRALADARRIGQRDTGDDPFGNAPEIHLSPSRITLLIEGRKDLLGEEVAMNMETHIDGCDACRESHSYLLGRLTEV